MTPDAPRRHGLPLLLAALAVFFCVAFSPVRSSGSGAGHAFLAYAIAPASEDPGDAPEAADPAPPGTPMVRSTVSAFAPPRDDARALDAGSSLLSRLGGLEDPPPPRQA